MCPIEEIFTHDQGNVTEKKVQWQKMALFLEGIQMGLQALCDEAIAETSSWVGEGQLLRHKARERIYRSNCFSRDSHLIPCIF